MQLLYWLSLSFGLFVLAQQAPEELHIKTTFEPSNCNTKAQKGDAIKVHYVRWLFAYLKDDLRTWPKPSSADRKAIFKW
jgi:hypothetical protein